MPAVVKLDSVSMRFILQHQRTRSFQDALVNFLHHRNGNAEEFWALRDVSFEVQPGETLGIIGQNGSGKSTILKLITRILEPTSGRVSVRGKVSALIELGAGFHPDLTGRENIYLNGSILGFSRKEMDRRFDEILAFSELKRFIDTPVKHYSSGMYMRLGFSVAISVDPDLLIIDEVLSVGDEAFQRKCIDRIAEFRRRGKTIIFVSHGLETVEWLCDRVIWLHQGEVQGQGSAARTIEGYVNELQKHGEQVRAAEHSATVRTDDLGEPIPAPALGRQAPEIVEVDLLTQNREKKQGFHTGETMIVRLGYRVADPTDALKVALEVRRHDGLLVYRASHQLDRIQESVPGQTNYVEVHFPDLALLAGTYEIIPSIRGASDGGSSLIPEPNRSSFSVWGVRDEAGLVQLEHYWLEVVRDLVLI